MKLLFRLVAIISLLAPAHLAQAQVAGSSGLNSVILKLFGKHDNFSVDADFQMLDPKQKPAVTLTLGITVSGGKLRADADMNTMKGPGITPQVIDQIKKMGLDRTISILRPDKSRMFLIYPSRKLYEDVPLPKEVSSVTGVSKIKKTPLGKETLDGHPCVKNKVVLADDKGGAQEMTVWEASDLKDFPIMVRLVENGQPLIVHNRNIKFVKPTADRFEIPTGYTKGRPQ